MARATVVSNAIRLSHLPTSTITSIRRRASLLCYKPIILAQEINMDRIRKTLAWLGGAGNRSNDGTHDLHDLQGAGNCSTPSMTRDSWASPPSVPTPLPASFYKRRTCVGRASAAGLAERPPRPVPPPPSPTPDSPSWTPPSWVPSSSWSPPPLGSPPTWSPCPTSPSSLRSPPVTPYPHLRLPSARRLTTRAVKLLYLIFAASMASCYVGASVEITACVVWGGKSM